MCPKQWPNCFSAIPSILAAMVIGIAPVLAGAGLFAAPSSVFAAETGPSGLPLPRFVSTRSAPVNVRVGPDTKYDIAWVFKKPGLPVEIIQEYEYWRKIRYVDGDEGWIHQSLLISRRTALVAPFGGAEKAALRARPEDDAPLRAWLGAGLLVSVDHCADGWCTIETPAENGHPALGGEVLEIELWGVYPDEDVN